MAVIALGLQATRATLLAYLAVNPPLGHLRKLSLRGLHDHGAIELHGKSTLYAMYHPGAFGRMARRRIDTERRDGW